VQDQLKKYRNLISIETDALAAILEKSNPVDVFASIGGFYAVDADFDNDEQGQAFQEAMQRLVEVCNFAIEASSEDWGSADPASTVPYLMEPRCFKLRSPDALKIAPFLESFLPKGDGLSALIVKLAHLHDKLPNYKEREDWHEARAGASGIIESYLGPEIEKAERALTKYLSPPFDYHAYLRSPEWKAKRDAQVAAAGGRCQVCNSTKQLNCHHRTYERIGNELPEDLFVLCAECHVIFHENGRLARPASKQPIRRSKAWD
jgi:hypothetical protein